MAVAFALPPGAVSGVSPLSLTKPRNPRIPCSLLQPPGPPPHPCRASPPFLLAMMQARRRGVLLFRTSSKGERLRGPSAEEDEDEDEVLAELGKRNGDGDGGSLIGNWATSVLLFGFYAAIIYYVFQLSPNQTPSRDSYFIQKLIGLKGDDGFKMNEVLVALWYLMGLWPIVYSMLLLPSGRSSRGKIPVWPFVTLSFFAGAYILIPYFILWTPPPPPVEEEEIGKWPLNFLESKISAAIIFAAGLGLIVYAGIADGGTWKEFYQYFRESKFIHVTSLDFSLLSAFSAFWVYNDMSARRWYGKGIWLLPLALIPLAGPALYILLRPRLSSLPSSSSSTTGKK